MKRAVVRAVALLAALAATAASAAPLDDIRAALRQGDYASAESSARALLAGTPTPYQAAWAHYLLGRTLERAGRRTAAAAEYEAVPSADPGSTLCDDALYYAGRLLEADSPVEAAWRYRRILEAYPAGDFRERAAARLDPLLTRVPAGAARNAPAARQVPAGPPDLPALPSASPTSSPATSPPPAEPAAPPSVMIQFQDAEIRQFIRWVSEATGRNFIVADGVTGNVTIFAGREVPFEEVYPVFLAVLDVKGFAVVEGAGVSKIVPRADAARAEGPIYIGPIPDVPPDRIVTRIFRLRHAEAGALSAVLRPLTAPNDNLIIHGASNSIVMTGAVANIGRISDAIEILDVPGAALRMEVIPLEYAAAEQAAGAAREVVAGLAPPGAPPSNFRVIPDVRTNAVVVLGDTSTRRIVRDLVAHLDEDEAEKRRPQTIRILHARAQDVASRARELLLLDGAAGRGRIVAEPRTNALFVTGMPPTVFEALRDFVALADTAGPGEGLALHVFRLQNAAAEELAPVLSSLVTGVERGTTVNVGAGSTPSPAPAAAPAAGDAAPAPPVGGATSAIVPTGPVRVVAEKQTNSLLVTATATDYEQIRGIIRTLDVQQHQVLVEAVILEASVEKARQLGIELNSLEEPLSYHTRALGGTNFGVRGLVASGSAEGVVGGIFRGSLLGPTLQALQKSADVNVVSSPQLLAENNTEAEIFVGNRVPTVTSQVSSSIAVGEGQTGIFQNVEYQDVGVRLKIKPHINDGRFVKMEIVVEVEGLRDAAVPNSALRLPSFTSRVIQTQAQVRDGDYVVIGGLISEQTDRSVSKVPRLGDIPILGFLFRRQSVQHNKTNLIIFLRPRIVSDPEGLLATTEEERRDYEAGAPREGGDPNSLDRVIPEEE